MTKKFSFQKFEGFTEIGEGEELPMIKKLKPNQFAVLNVIAMFQGVGGYCDTTQEQMASMLPYSRRTVTDIIKSLLEFTYEGKPVIEISKKTGVSGKEQNVYRLLPNKLFGVYGEQPTEPLCEETSQHEQSLCEKTSHTKEEKISKELKELKNTKEDDSMRTMKNKEVITLFCEAYEKKTMEPYKVNWARDNKFTTDFLKSVSDLKNNEIKRLVEITVEYFDKWSNNPKYPLGINSLKTEWIQAKAREVLKKEKEEVSQIVEQSVVSSERNDIALSSIMSKIKKKQGGN